MYEFVLYSRLGRTDQNRTSLHGAGRLDIVHECAVAALFLSHAIRKDRILHAVLNGPPNPPLHLSVDGSCLHDVRTDQHTWTNVLRKVLSGEFHPGISTSKTSFETLVRAKADARQPIYILEEKGRHIRTLSLPTNSVFVLGDHVGLPFRTERFALRYGSKVSLGKRAYLASTCIAVVNYLLDLGVDEEAGKPS